MLIASCATSLAGPVFAQGKGSRAAGSYPTKPVRLVAPFPPGGSSDLIARIFAQPLTDVWGQPFIVDNRPGAAGNVGTALVAKAPPDGYTLVIATIGAFAINSSLYKNPGFDSLRDFAPVATVAAGATMLVTHPSLPVKSVQELTQLARQKPGALSCGSGGIGTPSHLGCEMYKLLTGVNILHVPYKGTGQSITDLLGGQIHLVFASFPVVMPHVKSGKLRAHAVTTAERTPQAPDLPTLAEAGVSGYVLDNWWGIAAPARTPAAVVEALGAEIRRIAVTPEVKERLSPLGLDPLVKTREAFSALIREETARYAKLVKAAGIPSE